ncbi:hypothetical protein J6590_024162 [Homalodisca vitripennis]|nr:hypothetical protein J6590_024162 [Homalodisca vitripennis]
MKSVSMEQSQFPWRTRRSLAPNRSNLENCIDTEACSHAPLKCTVIRQLTIRGVVYVPIYRQTELVVSLPYDGNDWGDATFNSSCPTASQVSRSPNASTFGCHLFCNETDHFLKWDKSWNF